jgi:DNA-binding CsgD family transcriptional regulator
MKQQSAERVRRKIIQLCHAGLDSRTLRVEIIKRLRTVIPIDVAFFTTADPATLLFTGAIADEILVRATPQFIENEFLHEDVNKFRWLTNSKQVVSGLAEVTEHKLESSPRYRDILVPLALGDELRAALITGGRCWGFMCLHRDRSSPNFTTAEMAFISRLAPHIAEGLRTALLLSSATGPQAPQGPQGPQVLEEPGLLLLAEDFSVMAMTPRAEWWLEQLAETEAGQPTKRGLPSAVYAVATRLLEVERGTHLQAYETDHGPDSFMPKVRLRTASGYWLVLHASRLSRLNMQTPIAVIFEVAQPTEIAPLIVQAYGLSRRESEIMQSILCGLSTSEVADSLHISSYTVQDHLKAIFDKIGVRSRRELLGQLFAQQYQPRIASGSDLNANGWFK